VRNKKKQIYVNRVKKVNIIGTSNGFANPLSNEFLCWQTTRVTDFVVRSIAPVPCPLKVAMLFDHCAQCQRCCHVDPGYPALEVTLTKQEKKGLGSVCIEGNCEHLGNKGCTLGEAKPLSCKLYPLAYNPKAKTYYFDTDCPLMPAYQAQLSDPASEASIHLKQMDQAIQALSKTDPVFLRENYKIDSFYFDLEPLQRPGAAKKGQA